MAGSSAEDRLSMKRRSLILSAPRERRFFLREYFLGSLQSVIGRIQDNVVSFGPLAKNNEWHIVLKSEEAKNKLLSAGQLLIKGCCFWCGRPVQSPVLWAPPYLPKGPFTLGCILSGISRGIPLVQSGIFIFACA